MDLVDTTVDTDPVAKCLSSVKVNIDNSCTVSLTPLAAGGSFVDGIWSGPASGINSYTQLRECPVVTGAAVAAATQDAAGVRTALETAFEQFIYGANKALALTLAIPAAGKVTITSTGNLVYAITSSTVVASEVGTNIVTVVAGSLDAAWFKSGDGLQDSCGNGRYGSMVGTIKVCGLCSAGTSGDGYGCTSCDAGQYSAVGKASCSTCGVGLFAQGGNSDCLPCPAGTYNNAQGASECTEW